MNNVVDFQAWKDKKCTKSINKVFGKIFLPYLFTYDTDDVTFTITVEGEDYCIENNSSDIIINTTDILIENLLFDDKLFDPK